jgi:hypothetical protein
MRTLAQDLRRALRAEKLKMKNTLAFWLTLIAPAVIVLIQVIEAYKRCTDYGIEPGTAIWGKYATGVMIYWSLLMMPLFVTLETALVAQLDHANGQWKHLFALPVARGAVYAAKQIGSLTLIAISLGVVVVLTVLGGLGLRAAAPGYGFEARPPVADIVAFAAFVFIASWLIIALQTWVAQRWPSFVVASGVGITMTIIGVFVIQSDYAGYYPWTLPVLVANGFNARIHPLNILDDSVRPIGELLFGSVGGVVVAVLGGWDVVRRDVP